jgi:filamentous hemagglutinin
VKNDGKLYYRNGTGTITDLTAGGGGSGTVNSGTANQLAYYGSTGTAVSGLTNSASSVLLTNAGSVPSWNAISNDNFTQYALLAGRAGGQALSGGTAAADSLTLNSSSGGTSGYVLLQSGGGNVGIGTTAPKSLMTLQGGELTFSQLASDPSGTASYGSLYVKNDGKLYYRDGTGTIKDLTAAGGGTGDFMKNGSVAMTGALDMGSQNMTNIGTNMTASGALTIASATGTVLTLKAGNGSNVNIGNGYGTGFAVINGGNPTGNYLTVKGGDTGVAPVIGTAGVDTNIDIKIAPKGTGNTYVTSGNVGIGTTTAGSALTVGSSGQFTVDSSGNIAGTQLLATGIMDGKAPITVTTTTTASLGGTYKSGYTFNNHATPSQAITYTLPTAAAGLQYCVRNYTGRTGTLRVNTSAAGQYIDVNGANTTSGGYVISGGALGDSGCFVGVDATHWVMYQNLGTWTAN